MLIKTKLQAPSLRSQLLYRKDLLKWLSTAQDNSFIFLSGPAGAGKSSLVCQWIQKQKLEVAWYSLDEEDNNADLFFRYLLTSLTQTDKRLMSSLRPFLDGQQRIVVDTIIPHLIESLCTLDHDIYLVLDDFHQIANEQIHSVFVRLIQYLPAFLHLVILSRHRLPPPMEALIIKKERLEVSARDLKFTEEEAAYLFKEVIPVSFSPEQVRELNSHVEGWAAGLHLIGLSVRSKGSACDLSYILNQTNDQISSYLIHDILRTLPAKLRSFVFSTALLDRFNPELCLEITGMPDAAEILARLLRMNLFLIPLNTKDMWYRYHHMFSEVIRQQAAINDPHLIPATLRKAAGWLAKNKYLEDALRYAFRSKDFEFTADLMEDHILHYCEWFEPATGLRWISKLPEKILNQRALLRLHQCAFLSVMMEFSEIKELLGAVEKNGKADFSRYTGFKLTICQEYIAYFKCILHIFQSSEIAIVEQYKTLRDKVCPQNPLLMGAIETHILFLLILKGDFSQAEIFLQKVSGITLSSCNRMIRKKIYHAQAKALIAQQQGHLHHAETIIVQVQQILKRESYSNLPLAFTLHRQLGHIFYLQNKLEKAQRYADMAVKYCEYSGLILEIMAGDELQLLLYRAKGDIEKVLECIQQMRAYSIKVGMPRIDNCADTWAARIAMEQGNLAVAELWSKRRNLKPDEPFSLLFATECLIEASLFYAKNQYDQANHILVKLRSRCVRRNLGELIFKIDILQSATLNAMGQSEEAQSLLKQTLAFAEAEGYLRPFVNRSALITPILRRIAGDLPCNVSAAFFEEVFRSCDTVFYQPVVSFGVKTGGPEELTRREIEILVWMSKGFQNKEIAEKACIAVTTVKSHVSNILVKLSVKTRTQAVLKAKKLNIF